MDFVRVNVAVTKVCFFLVRSTSLELSPDSAAAGFLGFGLAAGIFSGSRDGKDGTAIDTVHCSQLCFAGGERDRGGSLPGAPRDAICGA